MNIIDAFPSPISYNKNVLTLEQSKSIVKFCDDHPELFREHPKLNTYTRTTYNKTSMDSNSQFKKTFVDLVDGGLDVIENVSALVNEYSDKIGSVPVKLTDMLITIQDKGGMVLPHQHGRALYSAVLYAYTSKDSNNIYFYNPNPYTSLNYYKENNKYSHLYYNFNPQIGDCIIFPGWMSHGTHDEINNMDGRIVLNFNFINM